VPVCPLDVITLEGAWGVDDREHTVIERMVTKYVNTLNHQPEDCRDARLAMLAAVRELYDAALSTEVCTSYGYLRSVLAEHERRSEVKRGDS